MNCVAVAERVDVIATCLKRMIFGVEVECHMQVLIKEGSISFQEESCPLESGMLVGALNCVKIRALSLQLDVLAFCT